jgi:hypothetical protein
METPVTTIDLSVSTFAVTITASTPIAAPPQRVWEVLTRTADYPQWNPFVRRLEGRIEVGERLVVDLQPGEKKPQTMRPTVVDLQPGRSFTWLGHVGVNGLLDGRHTFTVEPSGEGSLLVQHERLSGVLTPLFRSMLTRDTPRAFQASNEALAARALGVPA